MKIKVGRMDIFEQMGRIPITAITMWGIYNLKLSLIGEFFSMVFILIWMLLPSVRMFKIIREVKQ